MLTNFQPKSIVEATKQIDNIVFYLDAFGNLSQRGGEFHLLLEEDELRELKFIAEAGHQLLYNDGVRIKRYHLFIQSCESMIYRLQARLPSGMVQ